MTKTVASGAERKPRHVELPDDFALALAQSPVAQAAFERMPYSHQKEYLEWILEAKKTETRQRRISVTVEKLNDMGKR
jgi:uncharacterized protein YdeI (YjbR/CyaY-like superfamily)